jgi:hypothetical protein
MMYSTAGPGITRSARDAIPNASKDSIDGMKIVYEAIQSLLPVSDEQTRWKVD